MIPFRTLNGATFRCLAHPQRTTYANINFCAGSPSLVPFHLSLRLAEGFVVVNRKTAEGWSEELHFTLDLPPDAPVLVQVVFAKGAAQVQVNTRTLGSFGPLPRPDRRARFLLRPGFPNLSAITHCMVEGAVLLESIETRDLTFDQHWARVARRGSFDLTDRIELVERLPSGSTLPRHAVLIPGDSAAVPLRPSTATSDAMPNTFALPNGLAAVLVPGRIWGDIPADGTAEIAVQSLADGAVVQRFSLTRHDLLARLTRLCESGTLANDDLAALQSVEHVRHAAVWPLLPLHVRSALTAAAARFGLTDFLLPAHEAPLAPAAHRPPTVDPARHHLTPILAAIGPVLASRPDRQSLAAQLDAILTAHPGAPIDRVALSLCTAFCEADQFDVLFDATARRGLPPFAPTDDVGTVSLGLPFLLRQGDLDRVAGSIGWLSTRHGGWLATLAIGWVVRDLLRPARPPVAMAKRDAILGKFCSLISHLATDPWGRAPCHSLMAGLLTVLAQAHRLQPALTVIAQDAAMQAYGLSPRFWQKVTQDVRPGPAWALLPRLHQGLAAFGRLHQALAQHGPQSPSGTDAVAAALSTLSALGTKDATAHLATLLAPQDMATAQVFDAARTDLDLRALFHPEATQAAAPLLPRAAQIIETATTAPYAITRFRALERQLGERAWHFLATLHDADPQRARDDLRDLLDDLAPLCSAVGGYLGFAVAIGLLRGVAGYPALVQTLTDHVAALGACLLPADRAALPESAAVRAAWSAVSDAPPELRTVATALGLPPPAGAKANFGRSATPRKLSGPDHASACLFDTLVVVMSCRKHLSNRLPALRDGWLADLGRRGIPYIIVVGSGSEPDTLPADVVALTCPDDYEGLPQKTLAALTHVRDQTPYGRVLKIDDDCFLDVDEHFFSLSYAKADYYGRKLSRARGQMDRVWHMAKSTSPRGRLELDKSPEPSIYADGGSGYMLSRHAFSALLDAADSAEGDRLIRASFMEDKLVGDLLALRNLRVADHDYRVHVLRHIRTGGLLVPKWENTCLPFSGAGIKLAHLDGHALQADVARLARQPLPQSAKIWPTATPARLGAQSNALDLISPTARLDSARKAEVAVVACLRNELYLLPHFLAHYRSLGVESFLIADNNSDDGTLEYLADQPDVALFSVDTDYSQSHYGVARQQALMAAFRPGRWSLVADADELLTWTPDATGDLPALLREPDFAQADAARVFMLDLYPEGPLSQTDFRDLPPFRAAPFADRQPFLTTSLERGPFSNAPTWTSATRHRLIPGSRPELFVAQKIALLRYQPWMRLSDGLHYVAETRLADRALIFGHFKYNAAFRAKAAAEVARGQHFNNAEEYAKYLDLLSEGRETVFDPGVSVPWTETDFARAIFATGKPPPR